MFEIYRDSERSGRYRVVYFTELEDHNREREFNDAVRGDHFFDGFLKQHSKEMAKRVIEDLLRQLNSGERLRPADVEQAIRPYLAS